MRKRDFDIVFSGLALGEHRYKFELNDAFFEFFGYEDHSKLDATVAVTLEKHNTFIELRFELKGKVEVVCDRSGEPFMQDLQNSFILMVKFGEAFDDTDDETLILPQHDYQVNIGQYLYELVVLAIPLKNINPALLEEDADFVDEEPKKKEESIDPRWDKLKDLLN